MEVEGVVGSFGGGFEGRDEKGLITGREARIAIQEEMSLLDNVFVETVSSYLISFYGFSAAVSIGSSAKRFFLSSPNDAVENESGSFRKYISPL